MKHVKKTLFIFFLPALLSLGGCSNDDPIYLESPAGCNNDADGPLNLEGMTEQEIQALFVGKWQEIERGNNEDYPERSFSPQDYTFEFLPDSSVSYANEGFFPLPDSGEHTCQVDREFLHFYYENRNHSITFRYTFYTHDKFRMDFANGFQVEIPGPKFYIYKRIK
jgi:hypothetical protein